jgi:hypothetical protein
MRIVPAQIILIPLAAVISILLMAAGSGHMSVHEVSPVLGSQDAIQQWIDHETAANHCLPTSVDVNTVQQDALPTDPGKGHWFTTIRCNRRTIYIQWVILIFAPWAIMNVLLLVLNRFMPRNDRDYDYFK